MVKLINTSNQTVKPQVFIRPGDKLDVPDRIAEDLKRSTPELTRDQPANKSLDVSMSNTKAELLEAAAGLDVDESNTKAEILEALEA